MKRVILGGSVGAVVAFVWMMLSWMVLPFYNNTIHHFDNQDAVASTIMQSTPTDGIYVYPHFDGDELSCDDAAKKMAAGPFIYVQVKKSGINPCNLSLYLISLLIGFIGATFLSFILRYTSIATNYCRRIMLSLCFGLVVGILAAVPHWNWMGASAIYTLVVVSDYTITYLLVGLSIAGFVKPRSLT
ncbi:MAG: hypothetical protein K1060chlam2_01010 [Chlamydiae bacterium]|nr:hypothetical protein [Chlamydiota bacterium]